MRQFSMDVNYRADNGVCRGTSDNATKLTLETGTIAELRRIMTAACSTAD